MLQQVDLVQWTQLFFGVILIFMMLYRRQGLIPAVRPVPALTFAAQHAEVTRGGFQHLERIPGWDEGSALEVKGVTVRFGGLVALNKVDVTVPAGGVVAVIGPNGSGKSTLFNVITGLVPATGSIQFRGRELLGLKPHQVLELGVARTFQNIRLFPTLSVLENVLIGRHARLRSGPVASVLHTPRQRAEEEAARKSVRRHHRAVRQPAGAADRAGGERAVLRQPPPGRDRARAGVAAAHPAARRADRRHEPGGDAGTGRADQVAARDRAVDPDHRAQARRGDRSSPTR